jgi:hypothetical protein
MAAVKPARRRRIASGSKIVGSLDQRRGLTRSRATERLAHPLGVDSADSPASTAVTFCNERTLGAIVTPTSSARTRAASTEVPIESSHTRSRARCRRRPPSNVCDQQRSADRSFSSPKLPEASRGCLAMASMATIPERPSRPRGFANTRESTERSVEPLPLGARVAKRHNKSRSHFFWRAGAPRRYLTWIL